MKKKRHDPVKIACAVTVVAGVLLIASMIILSMEKSVAEWLIDGNGKQPEITATQQPKAVIPPAPALTVTTLPAQMPLSQHPIFTPARKHRRCEREVRLLYQNDRFTLWGDEGCATEKVRCTGDCR